VKTLFGRYPIGDERSNKPLVIPGFQAVREGLRNAERQVHEIWIEERKKGCRIDELLALAKARDVPAAFKSREEIESLVPGINHQGIVALAGEFSYVDLEDLVSGSPDPSGFRLLMAADHITDEGNLGALVRTAAFFEVQGLILPRDRSAQVTDRLLKRTSGAYLYLPVTQVVNLGRALDSLRQRGFWIIGAAGDGPESIYDFDWNRDTVLVLGSESRGLSRLVRDRCDELVRIPGKGRVESLNVSVAGGIILSEIRRRRVKEKP
jgi:23S rRNA (guanosine2251-2'-O)-methyltransferase